MLNQKIEWYKSKQNDLKESKETHKEALRLDKATFERELQKFGEQNQSVYEQKQFRESERDTVLAQREAKEK